MNKIPLSEAINMLNGLVSNRIARAEANEWGSKVFVGLSEGTLDADPLEAAEDIDNIAMICCRYSTPANEVEFLYDRNELIFWIKYDNLEKYIFHEA